MKKLMVFAMAAIMTVSALTGCVQKTNGTGTAPAEGTSASDEKSIVCLYGFGR